MNIAGLTEVDLAVYGGVAALTPGLIAIFNRPHFPSWAKRVIQVVVALAAAVVAYGLKNEWDFSSRAGLTAALVGVWGATEIAYRLLWKGDLGSLIESKINGGKTSNATDADIAPDEDATIIESFDEPVEELPVSTSPKAGDGDANVQASL